MAQKPLRFSIVEVEPYPYPGRPRFGFKITIDPEINDKDVIIATIMDLLRKRETGKAASVLVYGHTDNTSRAWTKADGEWSKDGKGWSGEEEYDPRLKVTFADGSVEYREFKR